jgi:hypothetical protein
MALPLTINNEQSQEQIAAISPNLGPSTVTIGGNVLGSGSSSATASGSGTLTFSTILLYGAAGLLIVFIAKQLE